jgi:hypothetical protein
MTSLLRNGSCYDRKMFYSTGPALFHKLKILDATEKDFFFKKGKKKNGKTELEPNSKSARWRKIKN